MIMYTLTNLTLHYHYFKNYFQKNYFQFIHNILNRKKVLFKMISE